MDEKEKKDFRKQHVIDLKGKEYLPVAARVFLARTDHPDWSICTEFRTLGDEPHVFAAVYSGGGDVLATAHKRVRSDGRGPAAMYPVETAETGAIGRALALCGYGTLSGDLDEGSEIADAPVEKDSRKWR